LFENTLEPLGNTPNTVFFFIFLSGGIYWMFVQNKLNKKAENDADQIK
jgi:cbb3-type cytochrome oxidase subunit 3